MSLSLEQQQEIICDQYKVKPFSAPKHLKVGIAHNVKDGILPIRGLRIKPEGDTTGWYIWAGDEMSEDPDFFVPLHIEHLASWCPAVLPYLLLPPGWKFIIAPNYEDVWFDENTLNHR